MEKKLLIILTFLLAIATGSWAEEYYAVWVGSTQVTSANATDVLGDGTVSYENDTKTLTLNNANITTECDLYTWIYWSTSSAIRANQELTITLKGTNTIDLRNLVRNRVMRHSIHVSGNLTINGDGNLNVYSGEATNNNSSDYRESTAIHAEATLIIDGNAKVYAEGGKSQCDSAGLRGQTGGVVVKGNAYVEAVGNEVTTVSRSSLGAWCSVNVEGGTFIAYGKKSACGILTVLPTEAAIYAGADKVSATLQTGTSFDGSTVKYVKVLSTPAPTGLAINEENFPDANFRAYLLEQEYGEDGVLTDEEIADIKMLNISGQEISSLDGIKQFTALETLLCAENSLTLLDVSGMTSLTTLTCNNNQLTQLNVTGCTAMEDLNCHYNKLTALDVSGMTSLKSLYCYNNQLESLNVTGCSYLETLLAAVNQLTTLSLQGCEWLSLVTIYENKIDTEGMETLAESISEASGGLAMLVAVNSAGNEQNVMTSAQVAEIKEKGWTVVDNNGYADYEGTVIPIEEITLTMKTGMTANDFAEEKQMASLGAVCIVALQGEETEESVGYSTKEGKLLFSLTKSFEVVVADDVTEADNFTYELTAADRILLRSFYIGSAPSDDIELHAKGVTMIASTPSIAEILAGVKTITMQFIANPPKEPEAYTVLSDDGKTLSFYFDKEKKARGGESINEGWSNYGSTVTSVIFDVTFADFNALTSTAEWFDGYKKLRYITGLDNLNTDNVTDMSRMFKGCSSMKSINVSTFNTGKVTSMYGMFWDCCELSSIDLSSFDTRNVKDMSSMFNYCTKLRNLNLEGLNTSSVTDMSSMFYYCSSLTELDLTSFNTRKVTDMRYMFEGCLSLTGITVSETGWSTDAVTSGTAMFSGCKNITGGNGTKYDAAHTDEGYARIDKGDAPGYLTAQAGTGITSVNGYNTSNTFYTPDGRIMTGKPTRQGFYISNGKKILVK